MNVISFDSETGLIAPGDLTPPLVCVSTSYRNSSGALVTELLSPEDGIEFFHRALSNKCNKFVVHNAPFDLSVACNEDETLVPLVFEAFIDGRIICTVTLQKLIDIALGQRKFRRPVDGYSLKTVAKSNYDLAEMIKLYYGEHVQKKDTWRLSYGFLRGFPLSAWPPSAVHYAMTDAELHLRLYEAQMRFIGARWGVLPDQDPQQRAAWALALMGQWGFRAEKEATERFLAHCDVEIGKMRKLLHAHAREDCPVGDCTHAECVGVDCVRGGCKHGESGILKPDNTRSMKEIRRRISEDFQRRGVPVPMTDPTQDHPDGQVKTDEETLKKTKDQKLHLLADSMTFEKHRGQWGPVLLEGVHRPICCKYNVLVDNGRTSCSGDATQDRKVGKKKKKGSTNVQNPPRKGDVRPCVVARRGFVLSSTDADTIELRANAQNCLELVRFSRMAEAIQDQFHHGGPDLHVVFGASVAGISKTEAHRLHNEDDVVFANTRQLCKHGNFSFAGGASAETFVEMCHGFGVKLGETYEEELIRSTHLRAAWFDTFTEEPLYFKIVGDMIAAGRRRQKGVQLRGTIKQLVSGRIRGETSFTAGLNSFFSGRVADAFKEILFDLALEGYMGRCTKRHIHGGSSHCTYAGRSILEGSRPIVFLHDEPFMEHPEDGTESDRAEKQQDVVVDVLNRWMPQVPCTSTAVLMRRWVKGGKQLRVGGKIVPVKPEKYKVGDKEKVKWVQDFGDTFGDTKVPSVPDNYEMNSVIWAAV
jgi:hypothetical protein